MLAVFCWFKSRLAAQGERGATAVEYGLMVALIAVAIIATVTLLGEQLDSLFGRVSNELPIPTPAP